MKDWFTAQELADESFSHFPTTKRGVNDFAEREGWNADDARCRRRAGRGGGREYHFSLLPTDAQIAYNARHIRIGSPAMPAAANDEAASRKAGADLTDRAALERDARLAIVRAFDQFSHGRRLNKGATECLFVSKYEAGTLQVEDWIRQIIKPFSRRTLARWRDEAKLGADRLAFDRSAARKGTGAIDMANGGQLRLFVLALIAEQPHLAAREVRKQCRHEFGDTVTVKGKTIPIPPVRTFQNTMAVLKKDHEVVLTKLTNPDLFRSTMKLAGVGTLRHIHAPNQLWQIDASPVDALCTDGRKAIYACIDIASRRTIWFVSDTPRASAVALLIRKAILAWGLPAEISTDNGSDFVARETQRLFASLGIVPDVCDAYSPEQKGHVERVIKTFQHSVGPLLPGYIGHSVADRKAIEGRKSFAQRLGQNEKDAFGVELTGIELQAYVDEWAEVDYAHAPHGGLKGQTPFQVAAASAHTIRTVDVRALDVLLMPAAGSDGLRTVQKTGIRIDHRHYLAAAILPGTQVFVRRDPNDIGRVIAFSVADGRYLGDAICAELAGIHPETFVRAQKELQAEIIADATREIEAKRRQIRKGPRLIERALEVARRDQPNVVALPKREEAHSTPAIAAALEAATADAKTLQPTLSPAASERHRQLAAEMARPSNVKALRTVETPQIRFRRALSIEAAIAAGAAVEAEDARWLGGYQTGSEYRAQRKLYDKFEGRISL